MRRLAESGATALGNSVAALARRDGTQKRECASNGGRAMIREILVVFGLIVLAAELCGILGDEVDQAAW